uniref:Uncharacterized protein n=1 Tax=Caenorhabditis tropicalis TaxID=1561998 RepID=A0A1I7UDV3_9PELO
MYQFSMPVVISATTPTTVTVRTVRGKFETVHKNRVKKFKEIESRDKKKRMEGNQNGPEEEKRVDNPNNTRLRSRSDAAAQDTDNMANLRSRSHTESTVDIYTPTPRRSRRIQNLPAEFAPN